MLPRRALIPLLPSSASAPRVSFYYHNDDDDDGSSRAKCERVFALDTSSTSPDDDVECPDEVAMDDAERKRGEEEEEEEEGWNGYDPVRVHAFFETKRDDATESSKDVEEEKTDDASSTPAFEIEVVDVGGDDDDDSEMASAKIPTTAAVATNTTSSSSSSSSSSTTTTKQVPRKEQSNAALVAGALLAIAIAIAFVALDPL